MHLQLNRVVAVIGTVGANHYSPPRQHRGLFLLDGSQTSKGQSNIEIGIENDVAGIQRVYLDFDPDSDFDSNAKNNSQQF